MIRPKLGPTLPRSGLPSPDTQIRLSPISNHRLLTVTDTEVSFTWKDYKHHSKRRVMTLSHEEFAASCSTFYLGDSLESATSAFSPIGGAVCYCPVPQISWRSLSTIRHCEHDTYGGSPLSALPRAHADHSAAIKKLNMPCGPPKHDGDLVPHGTSSSLPVVVRLSMSA